jgi:hypothetical protein
MQRLEGRKVGDLACRKFLQILEWVAIQKGKPVISVDCGFLSIDILPSLKAWGFSV